ncbi:MAG: hypothetical protein KC645_09825, partial [Gemmatimonadetes bacterium]|nr:hypothetical protein [Gemmatimonadota bacterium]
PSGSEGVPIERPRLPNASSAYVAEAKLRAYLLSEEHPTGRAKAAFFNRLGFRRESPIELRAALIAVGEAGELVARILTRYGMKYVIDGHLAGPTGVSATIRTVWIIEWGSQRPRLVTAYPAPGGAT